MKKENLYTYIGDNGTLTTPIHLPGVNSLVKVRLIADEGKMLENAITKVQLKSVVIAEKDVENWSEVE